MSNMRMKHKLIMSMMAGMIIIPGSVVRTQAAETDDSEKSLVPVTGIENILEASYQKEIKNNINLYLVPTEEGEYLNIAFSNTGDYTYIRSEADENSEWVGKLYSDSAAVVLEYLDGWTKIRSGNAEGYVPTETLFTGEEARSRSDEYTNENVTVTADCLNVREGHGTDTTVLTQINQGEEYLVTEDPVEGWYPIQVGEVAGCVVIMLQRKVLILTGRQKRKNKNEWKQKKLRLRRRKQKPRLQKQRLSQLRQGRKLLIMPVSLLGIHMCGAVQV